MKYSSCLFGGASSLVFGLSAVASPLLVSQHEPIPDREITIDISEFARQSGKPIRLRSGDQEPVRLHTDVPDLPRASTGFPDFDRILTPVAPVLKTPAHDFNRLVSQSDIADALVQFPLPHARDNFVMLESEHPWNDFDEVGSVVSAYDPPRLSGGFGTVTINFDQNDYAQPMTGFAIPSPGSASLLVLGSVGLMNRRRRSE